MSEASGAIPKRECSRSDFMLIDRDSYVLIKISFDECIISLLISHIMKRKAGTWFNQSEFVYDSIYSILAKRFLPQSRSNRLQLPMFNRVEIDISLPVPFDVLNVIA